MSDYFYSCFFLNMPQHSPQEKGNTVLIKFAIARKCQWHLKNNLTAEVKILPDNFAPVVNFGFLVQLERTLHGIMGRQGLNWSRKY